jgi:hypothetical protein
LIAQSSAPLLKLGGSMITSLGMQPSDVVSAMRTEVRAMATADAHALANTGVIPTQDQLFAWAKTAAGRFHPNMAAAAAETYIAAMNDQIVLPETGLGAALAVDLVSYFGRPVHTLTWDQFTFFVELRKEGNRFLRKGNDRAPESGLRIRLPRPQRRANVVIEGRTFDVDVSIELPCGAVARVLAEDVDTGRLDENDEHTSFRVRRWEGLVEVCWFARSSPLPPPRTNPRKQEDALRDFNQTSPIFFPAPHGLGGPEPSPLRADD